MGGDATDTSETLTGKCERTPAEGAVDSDVPSQSAVKKCRLGHLHLAFVMDKDVVKGHAQWRRSAMETKIGTQARKDPGAPSVMDGGGPVLSAWPAKERNRISGQELTEVEERVYARTLRERRRKGT